MPIDVRPLIDGKAAADHPGPIGAFFRRLRRRKKHNVAVAATARKLVTVAYLMLKRNEPYRYAKYEVVRGKLAACRRQADAPATARQAPGALNDLYRTHGLPASQTPAEWSADERRALDAAEATALAETAHRPPERPSRRRRATAPTASD